MSSDPHDQDGPESGAAAVEMREATERLREQAWMVSAVNRPAPDLTESDPQDAVP